MNSRTTEPGALCPRPPFRALFPLVKRTHLLFPPNPSIQRSLIAPIGGFTSLFSKPPHSITPFLNFNWRHAVVYTSVNCPRSLSSEVPLQCQNGSSRGAMDGGVATAATPATTHAERGLERGDKLATVATFLHAMVVTLDRIFERV